MTEKLKLRGAEVDEFDNKLNNGDIVVPDYVELDYMGDPVHFKALKFECKSCDSDLLYNTVDDDFYAPEHYPCSGEFCEDCGYEFCDLSC